MKHSEIHTNNTCIVLVLILIYVFILISIKVQELLEYKLQSLGPFSLPRRDSWAGFRLKAEN